MKRLTTITVLTSAIAVLALFASGTGILTGEGPGPSGLVSVRGETVTLYGYGIYRHMSAEVAPQGIAQDYVTFFIAVPLLMLSLIVARKGSLRARFILTGAVAYLLVTYLFYLMMGMYNALFLVYVLLLSLSFYAFILLLNTFDLAGLPGMFAEGTPFRFAGGFLVFNAVSIGLLWLGVVAPPLLDGTIIPKAVEHYTTLVVQGLDLALLLPGAFILGILMRRGSPAGILGGTVYLVFLSILMLALTAKVIAMGLLGYDIIPVVVIIPGFAIAAIVLATMVVKRCGNDE